MTRIVFLLLCNFLFFTSLSAQEAALTNANTAFAKQDWSAAIKAYQQHLKNSPADSLAWLNLGIARYKKAQYPESLTALAKAKKHNFAPLQVAFHEAKAHVLDGQKKQSLAVLSEAVTQGFPGYIQLRNDSDFAPLKQYPAFEEVLVKAKLNAFPCLADARFNKLDFWLGEWEVYVNGNYSANSSITKAEGGCTLHEDYRTLGGYAGRSFNYYDLSDSLFKQLWIDKNNGVMKFREIAASEGYLQMETYGTPQPIRMAYQLDKEADTVTQTLESSNDGGKTWQNIFTGVYKRQAGTLAPLSGKDMPIAPVKKKAAYQIEGITMAVHDMDKMLTFYREVFGVEFREKNQFNAKLYTGEWAGMSLLFCPAKVAKNTAKQNRHQFDLIVADIKAIMQLATKNGGTLMGDLTEDEHSWQIGIYDPDRNSIIFKQLKK